MNLGCLSVVRFSKVAEACVRFVLCVEYIFDGLRSSLRGMDGGGGTPYESDNLAVRCSLLYLKSSLLSRPTVSRSSLQQAPSKSIIIFISPIHYQLWITQTYAVATSVKFCNSTKSRSYGFHKLICTTAKKNFTRSRSIFDRLNNTRQLALVDFFLIFPEQRRLHAF